MSLCGDEDEKTPLLLGRLYEFSETEPSPRKIQSTDVHSVGKPPKPANSKTNKDGQNASVSKGGKSIGTSTGKGGKNVKSKYGDSGRKVRVYKHETDHITSTMKNKFKATYAQYNVASKGNESRDKRRTQTTTEN